MNAPIDDIGFTQIATLSQPALFLHLAIFLDNSDIVGDETFRVVSVGGQDSVSEPFEYQLQLRANTATQGRQLRFQQLIGKPVTFAIGLPQADSADGPTSIEESSLRFNAAVTGTGSSDGLAWFNGVVASFAMAAPGVYQLTVKPALWLLTLANRYTLYDDMTICDAIVEVLGYHHIEPDTRAVGGIALARTQDWLQAGESDYEFLRRLMGKAHLYFYFRHTPRSHTLVLANRPDYPEAMPGRMLRYTFSDQNANGLSQFDVIGDYRYQQSLQISAVHTVFTRQDEAWQVDGVPGLHGFTAAKPDADDDGRVFRQHKVFQYGSGRSAAEHFASLTEQASRTGASQLSGESYCALFKAGYRFGMTEDTMADSSPMPVQPSLDNRQFVLTKVQHEASLDGSYKNTFEATEADGLVSAFSIADTQQGTVLAIVVDHDSPGASPATWKYLEKTDFDPAVHGYADKESDDQPQLQAQGVYVRLAADPSSTPIWVKLAAHMQTAPEIGAQVMVGRSNDESELPEVSQVVSTVGSKTVTPSTWTANTSVGSSYGTRYGDGINIGFGKNSAADLGKAVGIVTTAYDSGRFRDASYGQGANYSLSTAESLASSASQDLGATYGPYGPASDILGVSEAFGSNFSRSEGQVQSSVSNYTTTYSDSTCVKTESHQVVSGLALSTDKTSVRQSTSNVGSTTSDDTIGSQTSTTNIGVQQSNSATGLSNQNSVTGISVQIAATGAVSSTNLTGLQDSTALTGLQSSTNLTGLADSTNLTGVSTQVSITGVSSNLNVSAVTNNITVCPVENRVSLTPVINEASIAPTGLKMNLGPGEIKVELGALEIHIVYGLELTL